MKKTVTLVREISESISFLKVNGYVSDDAHQDVYTAAIKGIANLDKWFSSMTCAGKAKSAVIISQLVDYQIQLKAAIKEREGEIVAIENAAKAAPEPATDEAKAARAAEERNNAATLLKFDEITKAMDSTSFKVGIFSSNNKIHEACAGITLNADAVEKISKCCRTQRALIIGFIIGSLTAGTVALVLLNKAKAKASRLEDVDGILDLDYASQDMADNLTLDAALVTTDDDDLLTNAAL